MQPARSGGPAVLDDWELEGDLLAGELPVHRAERLQLVLRRIAVLRVQVDLLQGSVRGGVNTVAMMEAV